MYKLSHRSLERLGPVHEDLEAVVKLAITLTEVDFTVLEGIRTLSRQQRLVEAGASWTMRSRHLTGHAVDLGAWVDGEIDWSWPLYYRIFEAMNTAAARLNINIEWGGEWSPPKMDGPHFQLAWSSYPI